MSRNNDSFTFFATAMYVLSLSLLVNVIAGNATWGNNWWLILLFFSVAVGFTGVSVNAARTPAPSSSSSLVLAPVPEPEQKSEPEPEPVTESADEISAEPDDLTRIEGIGPKTSAALITRGINTFAKLAEQSIDEIRAALEAEGVRFAPSAESWAEQAGYAAKGDWEGLVELQSKLDAGRYVIDDDNSEVEV